MSVQLLYVDEAGNAARYSRGDPSGSPLLVIAGLTLNRAHLPVANERMLLARCAAFGRRPKTPLVESLHANEVKGATLRGGLLGREGRRKQKHCWEYVESCMGILEDLGSRIFGNVWLKAPGECLDDAGVYGASLQHFAVDFAHHLANSDEHGLMLLDGRSVPQDRSAQRAVFDVKYGRETDSVPDLIDRLIEVPSAGNSKHFGGLQLVDVIASSLLYPLACEAYGVELEHTQQWKQAGKLRQAYGARLAALEYRWRGPDRQRYGGFFVTQGGDPLDPKPLTHPRAKPKSHRQQAPPSSRRVHGRRRGR
jgi:hypothetical protein